MKVEVLGSDIEVFTNGMVLLKPFEVAGNLARLNNGKKMMNVSQILKGDDISDFVDSLIKKYGGTRDDFIKVTGRGRAAKTLVHLYVAVKIAMKMDTDFEVEIVDKFVNSEILKFRIEGGEQFKMLNRSIDKHLPSPSGSNRGRYITTAKMIKKKTLIDIDAKGNTWNQSEADAIAQRARYEIENKMCLFLENGLVRDWDHFKELLENA